MLGFGKKLKTPDPTGQDARQTEALAPPPVAATTGSPDEAGAAKPSDVPKKPWFGKLFRSAKAQPSDETRALPEKAERAEPPAFTQPPEPARPLQPTEPFQTATPVARPLASKPIEPIPPAKAPERPAPVDQRSAETERDAEAKRGVLTRLAERLSRTRTQLGGGLGNIFLGRKRIDDELMEELETLLITADVGIDATARIIEDLAERVKRKSLADPRALLAALKAELREILQGADGPVRQPVPGRPQVVLMVGINGAGKTTTIGKLAKRLQDEGNSVMLAAGDTFRAAAVEQLETWGERNRIPVIAQQTGADSASVIFDALQAATARGVDVLIADTAGRLHTKTNLMDELTKVARVLKKIDPDAPHEVMLVVDATTGQNALNQAEHFHRAMGLTGITLTKLDGTAKGGILFAIAERLKVPIRFIGVGESIEDLRPFDPDEFIDALLG